MGYQVSRYWQHGIVSMTYYGLFSTFWWEEKRGVPDQSGQIQTVTLLSQSIVDWSVMIEKALQPPLY